MCNEAICGMCISDIGLNIALVVCGAVGGGSSQGVSVYKRVRRRAHAVGTCYWSAGTTCESLGPSLMLV